MQFIIIIIIVWHSAFPAVVSIWNDKSQYTWWLVVGNSIEFIHCHVCYILLLLNNNLSKDYTFGLRTSI